MSQRLDTPRRNTLYALLSTALICVVVGVSAWTATMSPVLSLNSIVTPTHARSFAFVAIAKPATTPAVSSTSPLPSITLPTEELTTVYADLSTNTLSPDSLIIETPTISQTTEPMAYAAIVADTPPAPGYSNTTQYDAPPSYGGNKYILIDISEQHMYVYEGDALVYSFVSSTGMHNATRAGSFSVLDKIPNAYGATWDIWMPNWLGIYWAGSMENGIHALPILPNGATLWAGYLGVPISYGCIVLGTYEAQLLYDWADIGTPVEIQW
jgi:lipoprotein-anchoring transpeptidase ErfK/SrfK